ncbi:xanthine dehydrogenase family protein molybdopterin-binding subunit [Streptomyces sp. URMC 123]|uniref:xanthine dehydrogenase family protein molybdopterin-binding subunit n=1 Tax=Streptomyces sp. URMC 123 TaxID=3423403 RepID=UPI003F1BF4BD
MTRTTATAQGPAGAGGATPATGTLGAPAVRLEGLAKVTGAARYAAEHTPEGCAYAWPVPAPVAKGEIASIDCGRALAEPGALAVLTHENAPRLREADDGTLAVLQSSQVAHRGQYVALAVARTPEAARATAEAVRITYASRPHDVVLTSDHPGLRTPDEEGIDRAWGDFDTAYAAAEVRLDAVYTSPAEHNHPMEPHATVALWEGDRLRVYDSNQGSTTVRRTLAALFGLPEERVTVVAEHIGGGFGSKGTPRPQVVLAAMAARAVDRPVKLVLPRNQLAAVVGYRAATEQRVRIGAGADGRIAAVAHEVISGTATIREFYEQAAQPTRSMYTSPHSRTTHRVARLDVPPNSWLRAPGYCPGMYALECAMDELAERCGLDPIELRVLNEPERDPASGLPFSSRQVVECLREGARRFGWRDRDPEPGARAEGRLLVGTGVAASMYPAEIESSTAEVRAEPAGDYVVRVNATDIGTGARTVLAQIAAEALEAPLERVRMEIGHSDLPPAPLAGGSIGTASWGWAVHKACRELRERLAGRGGVVPGEGLTVRVDTAEDIARRSQEVVRAAFGAQFAEVAVDRDTGEVRARRLLGVFATGRVLNARTARSQFIGGMTMGLSMALLEGSTMDPAFGDHAERDLASYHVAACADVVDIEAHWLPEEDGHLNPMGAKGIGEIGIVGTAAAVANAVHHATGVRVRDLPIHPEALLERLGG